MKAISIKQPWASLVIYGGKDIENRTWRTTYRGPVLIHASKRLDQKEIYGFLCLKGDRNIVIEYWPKEISYRYDEMPLGGIIGVVDIVDCVTESDSKWFVGPFGFVLANPRPLPFHACRGALGFWNCDHPIQQEVQP